ncbi:pentapeptide repeat-containing protein [Streptomyces xinghaiensis]|uniref:pentapeptide repeat-containing protein n=1 Tax=Streptomyces xinghaiensis TaxID=1038928 RepID=UPI00342AD058
MTGWGLQWQRRSRLWPVGRVLVLVFLASLVVAGGVFWALAALLDVHQLKTETQLTSATLFELVKLSAGVVAGSGALVALVVAYRRQRVDEDGAMREATRLHTERFTAAVAQLGNVSAAVRLGGVHALSGLADDAPTKDLRQTCIDVLCAYLRLPYAADPGLGPGDQDARHEYLALREVRHTVIRLIHHHLRLAADSPNSWQGHSFDFSNAVFDGGDWSRIKISGNQVSFDGAEFSGGRVSFGDANFSDSDISFYRADFSAGKVSFLGAKSDGGWISFPGAQFSGGEVSFGSAALSGRELSFSGAEFSGGKVSFSGAMISSGAISFFGAKCCGGEIHFSGVRFSGGKVWFNGAIFSGGRVSFSCAKLDGGSVSFDGAEFSGGEVSFAGAGFSGSEVSLLRAVFSGGTVSFSGAGFFRGRVSFDGAAFSGSRLSFDDAFFSGGEVDLRNSSGNAPENLVPADGGPLPPALLLPERWYQPAA